jgi:hypothetical protein
LDVSPVKANIVPLIGLKSNYSAENGLCGVEVSDGVGTFVPMTMFDFSKEKETLDELQ